MSSSRLRNQLLGRSTFVPPKSLQKKARFDGAASYAAFLDAARQEAGPFWMDTARTLRWTTPPRELGGAGDWFCDGELNIDTLLFGGRTDADVPFISTIGSMDQTIETTHLRELSRRVDGIAAQLMSWTLEKEARVLIAVTKDNDALAAIIACLKLGLTCVPMDPSRSKTRIPRRSQDAGCCGAIVDADSKLTTLLLLPNLLALEDTLDAETIGPKSLHPMHPAFVLADSAGQLFTLPLAGFLVQAVSAFQHMFNGDEHGDPIWLMMPSHYASYLSIAFGAMVCGGRIGTISVGSSKTASALIDAIHAASPKILVADVKTLCTAVEPAMDRGERANANGPEVLAIDGEIVEPRLWAYLRNGLFDGHSHVVQMLSRPESGGFVAGPNTAVTPVRSASVSLPAPGVDLLVMHTNGKPCRTGEGGLLALRNPIPGMALELQDLNPPITIEIKARQDQAGYFWPMGEVKLERAKAKGVTIPEVEGMMVSIQGVELAAIIRYTESDGSKRTRAYIKPSTERTDGLIDRIRSDVRNRFGEEGLADHFQLVKHLPYGKTGKLLRSVLRRLSEGDPLSTDDIDLLSDEKEPMNQ